MTLSDFQHRLTDWGHDMLARGWPGFVAWIGGISLTEFASSFSYFAGGIWFAVQTYYYIKQQRRKDK